MEILVHALLLIVYIIWKYWYMYCHLLYILYGNIGTYNVTYCIYYMEILVHALSLIVYIIWKYWYIQCHLLYILYGNIGTYNVT